MTWFWGANGSQASLEPRSGQNPLNVLQLCSGEWPVPLRILPELCPAEQRQGLAKGSSARIASTTVANLIAF